MTHHDHRHLRQLLSRSEYVVRDGDDYLHALSMIPSSPTDAIQSHAL